jgi:hypothetical protein
MYKALEPRWNTQLDGAELGRSFEARVWHSPGIFVLAYEYFPNRVYLGVQRGKVGEMWLVDMRNVF